MLFRRFLTLEALEDKPEDIEFLKELTKAQRLALYRYLTSRAYRLNKDTLRDSALWMRNDLLSVTKGEKNTIPFDREPVRKKQSDFLPAVFNDPLP